MRGRFPSVFQYENEIKISLHFSFMVMDPSKWKETKSSISKDQIFQMGFSLEQLLHPTKSIIPSFLLMIIGS